MEELEKQSTKCCPKCGNEQLLLLRTLNQKICTDCCIVIPWYLEKDQEQFIKYTR
jgi:hypothetical protein